MATPVVMPKFGQTMTEGTIVNWEKTAGAEVKKGEVLLRIETDKTEMDVEAEQDGCLLRIEVPEGATVACGVTLALIGERERFLDGNTGASKPDTRKPCVGFHRNMSNMRISSSCRFAAADTMKMGVWVIIRLTGAAANQWSILYGARKPENKWLW